MPDYGGTTAAPGTPPEREVGRSNRPGRAWVSVRPFADVEGYRSFRRWANRSDSDPWQARAATTERAPRGHLPASLRCTTTRLPVPSASGLQVLAHAPTRA